MSRTRNNEARLTAHPTYRSQACAQALLRLWRVGEPGLTGELLRYLSDVKVSPSFVRNEGRVQEQWFRINMPWTPFDREGVLGGPHQVGREFPLVQAASDRLTELAQGNGWASPNTTGTEIDQLATDPEGRLVLLELKDASKRSAEIYYSPFQLLQYVWEWHSVLDVVRPGLQAVINARMAVGLSPRNVPALTGGVRAAVGFGLDDRSREVKRRYDVVLDVVNQHLPEGVGPIETWECAGPGPRVVA